jgi:predicted transcriptional regulator
MADDMVRMTLRLPPELHERLGRAADRDHRSRHAEVLAFIEQGLAAASRRDRRAATIARKEGGDGR